MELKKGKSTILAPYTVKAGFGIPAFLTHFAIHFLKFSAAALLTAFTRH
jgi:hypothetical protein